MCIIYYPSIVAICVLCVLLLCIVAPALYDPTDIIIYLLWPILLLPVPYPLIPQYCIMPIVY